MEKELENINEIANENNDINNDDNKKGSKKPVVIAVIILVIALLILFMRSCSGGETVDISEQEPTPVVGTTATPTPSDNGGGQVFIIDEGAVDKSEYAETKKNPLSGRNVFFAGYADATLNGSSTVALENLPENKDFFMRYVITDKDTNTVVYETNLIPSGQCIIWTPGETLKAGTYNLQFLAVPYYHDGNGNFQQLTSGCNDIVYTIVN